MPFIIATAVLLITSSVYLLHEYWSGVLSSDELIEQFVDGDREPADEALRAA